MAQSRPFAYNTGALISGTTQLGDLAIGVLNEQYTLNYGGVRWWNGPDEDLGYVIAVPVSGNTQPTPDSGTTASVGFYRSKFLTNPSFLEISDYLGRKQSQPPFATTNDAYDWLTNQGYWTSYVPVTPTPTATLSLTQTPTPTLTQTPTPSLFVNCDTFTFIGNNATTTSNSAINDGTSGWDSSAYSLETFTGPVSVTFQTSANGNILMGGFSYNPTATPGSTYEDTSYGIYLYNSDQIEIYENGGQVAVLNVGSVVSSSDVWEVDYDGTSVKYYYNSTLIYTSTNAVTQPLHVFFPLFTPNEGAVNICVIGTLSPTPTPTPTLTQTPTPTITETPTGTPSETPTNTPTPTSTDLSSVTTFTISGCTNLNVLVADLGPSALAPGDVFNFTFTGGTPNGCYRIVEKTVATPTDGATPLLFYVNCAACQATLVTPTPTTTSTPTPSVTNTQTPSVTPTLTPTPSVTPEPVTGYSFNLVALPYNFPSSGNTIMNGPGGATSGSTNPNALTTSARGIYWNSIDTDGIDRTNYFSQFTGQSVTITMTQTGSTAIYSGDSQSLKSWSQSPSTGFVFGTNIQIPPLTAATGNAVLIQSASTQWTIGLPVYISVVNNNPSVTPTPTATSVTPTPTPTSGASGNFNISVSQVGPDVVWSGSGSFNLTSLTLNENIPGVTGGFNQPFAQFIIGPTSPSGATTYSGSSFTTFPTSFGSGGGLAPSSSSGSLFGVVQTTGPSGPREVVVPPGYVSGTVISGSMTYNTQTIAGMGLSGGTYTWAWGSGGSASSIVMTITP